MKSTLTGIAAAALLSIAAVGCQSGRQEGVTNTYRSQSIDVAADVETTTKAAETVFKEDALTDVSMQATKLDGEASGVTANKTKIWASVKKSDKGSSLSVQVGKIGDPKVGADYAKKIQQVAEGKKM